MLIDEFHPEDIKAAIRKRYRSLKAFERALGLSFNSPSEIFRGRTSARTEKAIRRVLRDAGMLGKVGSRSIILDTSSADADAHRQKNQVA